MDSKLDSAWQTIKSEPGPDLIIFQARFDQVQNPRNARQMKAVVLESPDWVNIVALTPEQRVIIVRQHRFGVGYTTTEIPAGLVEPGETPHQAAIRELREETGCTTANWQYLGWVEANPAFLSNRCHLWLAQDVSITHPVEQDDGENVSAHEMTLEEIRQEIAQGTMRNAFTILALSQIFDIRAAMHNNGLQPDHPEK